MPNRYLPVFALAVLVAFGGSLSRAQDEGPSIVPDHNPKPPHQQTTPKQTTPKQTDVQLIISCDLPCKWSLGDNLKDILISQYNSVRLHPGKYTILAKSLDGLDQITREFSVADTSPIYQRMLLAPVRDARLKSEKLRQEIQDILAQAAAKEKTRQEAQTNGKQAETDYEQKNYSGAAILAMSSCNAQDAVGCRVLGNLYLTGKSVPRDYPRARVLFEQSCKANDARACNDIGWMAMYDLDLPHDYAKARTYTSSSCNVGEMRGCLNFGILLENGAGGDKDGPRALQMYSKACNGGFMEGCAYEGEGYANSIGGSEDLISARTYLEKACNGGSDSGCEWFGTFLEYNSRDYARGRAVQEKSCRNEDGIGCMGAALDAVFARGGARDLNLARAELTKSCDLDNMPACTVLGESYSVDAQQNFNQGLELFRKACKSQNNYGCFDLGLDHQLGYGTAEDFTLARQQLQKSCRQPDDIACKELNVLHDYVYSEEPYSNNAYVIYAGECQNLNLLACEILVKLPVQKNLPTWTNAAETYHSLQNVLLASCIAGNPRACSALGEIFDKGLGIYRDAKLARYEFGLACGRGMQYACTRQKQVR